MKRDRYDLKPAGYPYSSEMTAKSWMGCFSLVKMALNAVLEAAQSNYKSILFVGRAAFHTTLNNIVQVHKQIMVALFPLKLERSILYCSEFSRTYTQSGFQT